MKAFDASIPVLTEVLADTPAPAAAEAGAALSLSAETDWVSLQRVLTERILRQMQSRVDFVLEQRIKDSMAEVLNHALQDLTTELRAGLQDTIAKIVSRAVQQEITHLQASAPPAPDAR